MLVKKRENKIQITFTAPTRTEFMALVAFVKTLPGSVWHAPTKSWFIPLPDSMPSLDRLRERGFAIQPELLAYVVADQDRARASTELAGREDAEFDSPLPLYPFQRVVSAFMVQSGSCLNACGVRTGKTIMTIATIKKLGTVKNLIIVPGSVLFQWGEEELPKWDRDAKVFIIYGNKTQRSRIYEEARNYSAGRFYVVLTYDVARNDVEELEKF